MFVKIITTREVIGNGFIPTRKTVDDKEIVVEVKSIRGLKSYCSRHGIRRGRFINEDGEVFGCVFVSLFDRKTVYDFS